MIRGADISILADMEKSGTGYYENGVKKKDALQILKEQWRQLCSFYDYGKILMMIKGNSYGVGTNDLKQRLLWRNVRKTTGIESVT